MILAARIAHCDSAADLLEQQAHESRLAKTPAPDHQWASDDNCSERADHDRLLVVAEQMRRMAREMRRELDQMERITGRQYQPRRTT